MGWIKNETGELEWMDDKEELMLKTKEELIEIIYDLESKLEN